MTYLCDLFFFFFTLIIINQIMSLEQTHLIFCKFFQNKPYYFWKSKESKKKKRKQIIFKKQKFSLSVLLSFCFIFFFANFSLALPIKKACTTYPKYWKTNYYYQLIFQIINTIIYSTFQTVLCVHGTALKVFLKLINVNLVTTLKRSFACS